MMMKRKETKSELKHEKLFISCAIKRTTETGSKKSTAAAAKASHITYKGQQIGQSKLLMIIFDRCRNRDLSR